MSGRTFEVTAHIIGAPPGMPTGFGPEPLRIDSLREALYTLTLDGFGGRREWLHVQLSHWTPTYGTDWLSVHAELSTMNGWHIGRRPALVYDQPYDVPTYASFHAPELHVTLGIRRTA